MGDVTQEPVGKYIGCGCLVSNDDGEFLLVRETKAIARGRLALPAGKLEPDESIPAAAMRETLEETGLEVELDGLLGIFHCERTSENSFGVNFVYAARQVGGELTVSDEHPELQWLTSDEIHALHREGHVRGAHVVDCVDRHLANERLPSGLVTAVLASN